MFYGICTVPVEVMKRLDVIISGEASQFLAEGEYKLTVATVRDSDCISLWIDGAEIAFPYQKASLPIILRNLLGSGPVDEWSATPHMWRGG